jgi:Ca2+-binding EF-hand superfamily protein
VGGAWQGMQTFCSDSSICDSDCPEDLDGDGVVNVNDILAIVGSWGSSNSTNDLDGSGIVDTGDLLAVIGTWGPCE